MKKMGIGLIGCGNISTAYLQLASQFSPLEMRAVADLDMAAAKTQAEKFNLRALSVPELFASGDIDIIVNLTVPAAHFEVTKQILQAGKHAFSEKPFVLSLQEGEALRKLADETGLRIGSAPDTFLGGAHQLARSLIDQGTIGEVLSGTCHVMSRGMEAWHPNPDFFFQPGGGPVLDLGPYYISNLVQLIGPVKAVITASIPNSRAIFKAFSGSFSTRSMSKWPVVIDRPYVSNSALVLLGSSYNAPNPSTSRNPRSARVCSVSAKSKFRNE